MRLLPALLASLALVACNTLPDHPGAHVEVLHQGELEQVSVRDVIVAPVINESTAQRLPEDALRASFSEALVKRRYSPLAIAYVDDNTREASAGPSMLGEDAVLQVVVKEWDTSMWDSKGVLMVEIEAWMQDSKRSGRELWGARLERRFSLRKEIDIAATEDIVLARACDKIADELLEMLPAHSARP